MAKAIPIDIRYESVRIQGRFIQTIALLLSCLSFAGQAQADSQVARCISVEIEEGNHHPALHEGALQKILDELSVHEKLRADALSLEARLKKMTPEQLKTANIPEFEPSLDWIISSLGRKITETRSPRMGLLGFVKKRSLLRGYQNLLDEALRMRNTGKLTYFGVNRLALRTVSAYSNDKSTDERMTKLAERMLAFAPEILIFPTPEPLTMGDFNRISGKPIFYVGLIEKKQLADALMMSPLEFYIHDIAHTYHQILGRFRSILTGNPHILTEHGGYSYNLDDVSLRPDQMGNRTKTAEASAFSEKFFHDVSEIKDPILRYSVEKIWSNAFREEPYNQLGMNPTDFSSWLESRNDFVTSTYRLLHGMMPEESARAYFEEALEWLNRFNSGYRVNKN